MAASPSAISTGAKTFLGYRLILVLSTLAGIIIVSGLLVVFNYYWLGVIFFFAGLMLLVSLTLEKYELRNLCLLLVLGLAVAVIVGMFTQQFLSRNPQVFPIAQSSDLSLLTISILIGIGAAIFLVVIPFLLLVGIATAGIPKRHKDNDAVPFFEAYEHVFTDILGIFRLWVTVEEGKIKGDKKSLEYLERWGGPGWLTVYPGQVVVLHKWGKVSRVVGRGSTLLEPREQIKAVLPLTTKGGVNIIENVLTLDRIPLKIAVAHAVQLEPAADTQKRLQQAVSEARKQLGNLEDKEKRDKIVRRLSQAETQLQSLGDVETDETKRLQQEITEARKQLQALEEKLEEAAKCSKEAQTRLQALENDKLIGDDYDQCYESVAKLAAAKAGSDIWESMKGSIASNLRDIVMTCKFDDLFRITDAGNILSRDVQRRKIAEIEELVAETVKVAGLGKGLVLRVVDISEVKFPEQVERKLISEAVELAEERFQNIKAQTEEEAANVGARIVQIEADAKSYLSQAEVQSESDRDVFPLQISGIAYPIIAVENGQTRSWENYQKYLDFLGGPSGLIVDSSYVVVLHQWGKVTRTVGLGSVGLEPGEKIKAILPLTTKDGVNIVENVLTRDRIPLKISIVHAVQLEPAVETKKRLQQAADEARIQLSGAADPEEAQKRLDEAEKLLENLEKEEIIGDDYDQCYEYIAKLAAAKAPDIWASMKDVVASNLRDVIMSCDFDELFDLGQESENLAVSVDYRKIAEIEQIIFDRARPSGLSRGIVLRAIDINEIDFPLEIREKMIGEITALLDARIEQTRIKAKEIVSRTESKIALEEATTKNTSIVTQVEAEARAELIRGRAKTQARAEYFKQIIRTLKAEGQTTETIGAVVQGLTTSISAEEQWKQIIELVVQYNTRGELPSKATSELSSGQD